MKRTALFSLLLSGLWLVACRKHMEHCEAQIYRIPGYVAFVGFSGADLDTVIVARLAPGGAQPYQTDTLVFHTLFFAGDTAYNEMPGGSMVNLGAGIDYRITLPGVRKSFRLANLLYNKDSVMRWDDPVSCLAGPFTEPPYSLTIDGVDRAAFFIANTSFFYLE